MNTDPIIDEIRKYREEHAKSCDYDLKRIVEDIRKNEQRLREDGWQFVYSESHPEQNAAVRESSE